MNGWQDYETIGTNAAPGAAWLDFFAVAFGGGIMLLVLHLLGVLSLLTQWATLG